MSGQAGLALGRGAPAGPAAAAAALQPSQAWPGFSCGAAAPLAGTAGGPSCHSLCHRVRGRGHVCSTLSAHTHTHGTPWDEVTAHDSAARAYGRSTWAKHHATLIRPRRRLPLRRRPKNHGGHPRSCGPANAAHQPDRQMLQLRAPIPARLRARAGAASRAAHQTISRQRQAAIPGNTPLWVGDHTPGPRALLAPRWRPAQLAPGGPQAALQARLPAPHGAGRHASDQSGAARYQIYSLAGHCRAPFRRAGPCCAHTHTHTKTLSLTRVAGSLQLLRAALLYHCYTPVPDAGQSLALAAASAARA